MKVACDIIASDFQISGNGSIETSLFKEPFLLNKFTAAGRYDAPHDQLTLDNINIDGKQAAANAKADVTFGWKDLPTPKELLEYGERWRPHRTTAAWYLWRALEL